MKADPTNPAHPLPRIIKNLWVEPFQITSLWTTSEIRVSNFELLFPEWQTQGDTRLSPLMDYATFQHVAVSPTRTLCWPSVVVSVPLRDRVISGPLDLDPDVLYHKSILVKKTKRGFPWEAH